MQEKYSHGESTNFLNVTWPPMSVLSSVEKDAAENAKCGVWSTYKSIIYKFASRPKFSLKNSTFGIVSFDLDGTLIKTKSGKRFADDSNYLTDWTLWDPNVVTKLRNLHEEGYILAIISNQNGIGKKHLTASQLQNKIDNVLAQFDVPIDFICATSSDDIFRKPRTGMWDFLLAYYSKQLSNQQTDGDSPITVSKLLCRYVGDAAGRAKQGKTPKDFSDSDLKLALNLDISFSTPESFFLQSKSPSHCSPPIPPLDGVILSQQGGDSAVEEDQTVFQKASPGPEMVLLVAPAACGKSTLSEKFASIGGFVRINQDTLGSFEACRNQAIKLLQKGILRKLAAPCI